MVVGKLLKQETGARAAQLIGDKLFICGYFEGILHISHNTDFNLVIPMQICTVVLYFYLNIIHPFHYVLPLPFLTCPFCL